MRAPAFLRQECARYLALILMGRRDAEEPPRLCIFHLVRAESAAIWLLTQHVALES